MKSIKERILTIVISFDQFIQTLVYLGKYSEDETISGVLGMKKQKGTMNSFEKGVCWFLRKLDNNHCIKSIDEQEWL